MKFLIHIFSAVLCISFFHYNEAQIIRMKQWVSLEGAVVYTFADLHAVKNKNHEQRCDILQAARKLNAVVLVEDSAINQETLAQYIDQPCLPKPCYDFSQATCYKERHRCGLMVLLHSWCTYAHIPAHNVEFRYYAYYPDSINSKQQLYNDLVAQEIKAINYKESQILTDFYTSILDDYYCKKAIMERIRNGEKITLTASALDNERDIYNLIEHKENLSEELFKFLYSSHLIDARIIHTLYQCQDKKLFLSVPALIIYKV